jgi:hypothetical protein
MRLAPIFRVSESLCLIARFDASGSASKRSEVENTALGCPRGDLTPKTEPFKNLL